MRKPHECKGMLYVMRCETIIDTLLDSVDWTVLDEVLVVACKTVLPAYNRRLGERIAKHYSSHWTVVVDSDALTFAPKEGVPK